MVTGDGRGCQLCPRSWRKEQGEVESVGSSEGKGMGQMALIAVYYSNEGLIEPRRQHCVK